MDDRGARVNATAITMAILSFLAVVLRFLSRRVSEKAGYWWDDWASLAALPFVLSICALSLYWVSIGLGQHIDQVLTPESTLLLPLFLFVYLFNTALALAKASVLLFYARVFRVDRWFLISLWFMGGLVISWWIAIGFLATFSCTPVAKAWNPALPGTCLKNYTTFISASIPNTITDFILLLLPSPMLWRLQMKRRQKLVLVLVFLCGYCVVIVSVIRLVSIVDLGDRVFEDITWNIVPCHIYTILESSIALIAVCLPSIFHLFKRIIRPHLHSGTKLSKVPSSRFCSRCTATPTDGPKKHSKGFTELNSEVYTGTSEERLCENSIGDIPHVHASYHHGSSDIELPDLERGALEKSIHRWTPLVTPETIISQGYQSQALALDEGSYPSV